MLGSLRLYSANELRQALRKDVSAATKIQTLEVGFQHPKPGVKI